MTQEAAKLTKKITLELDVLTGDIALDNPGELSDFEILGILECGKVIIYKDMMEG